MQMLRKHLVSRFTLITDRIQTHIYTIYLNRLHLYMYMVLFWVSVTAIWNKNPPTDQLNIQIVLAPRFTWTERLQRCKHIPPTSMQLIKRSVLTHEKSTSFFTCRAQKSELQPEHKKTPLSGIICSAKMVVSWRGTISSPSCKVRELQNFHTQNRQMVFSKKETDSYLMRQLAGTNKSDILLLTESISSLERLKHGKCNEATDKRRVCSFSFVGFLFFLKH